MAYHINKLHILVHPGFDFFDAHTYPDSSCSGAREESAEKVLNQYKKKIDSLADDDVLALFSASDKKNYRRDYASGSKWTEIERYAKTRLNPRRVIRLSDPSFLCRGDDPTSLSTLFNILDKRGFDFPEDTPCEIWGESAGECVAETALQAEKHFTLKDLTIPLKATDEFNRPEEINRLTQSLREMQPKTKVKVENRL
ncbi:MAG: hypothetical protein GF334_04260 [Candidatus Altiarchaeales archaeon]|nr:hypothetical protein [Candidatus Altiarchaeales archaeon]